MTQQNLKLKLEELLTLLENNDCRIEINTDHIDYGGHTGAILSLRLKDYEIYSNTGNLPPAGLGTEMAIRLYENKNQE